MLCVAPAAAPGARPVGVVQGLVGVAGGAPTFTHLRGPSVLAAAPAVASTVGDGTEVTFYLDARGGDADAEVEALACHVDGAVVPARAVAEGVSCALPARAAGMAEISLVSSSFAHGVGPRGVGVVGARDVFVAERSEEHTSELQSPGNLVCRLLLEKKKTGTQSPTVK